MENNPVSGLTPMERPPSNSDDLEMGLTSKPQEKKKEEQEKKEQEEEEEKKGVDVEIEVYEQEEEEKKKDTSERIDVYQEEEQEVQVTKASKQGWQRFLNKGDLSNCITFCIMVLGIGLNAAVPNNAAIQYILAFGLFGFAGGFTNWLAVKMLFDRIPFLVGSGVIPRQFKAIRNTVKNTIMKTFFDQRYLGRYIDEHAPKMLEKLDLPDKLTTLLNDPAFIEQLTERLTALSQKPEGMMLQSIGAMFGGVGNMVKMMQPMLANMGKELVGGFLENLTGSSPSGKEKGGLGDMVNVDELRDEIDKLMSEKLKELTPDIVKGLMEEVIREHLGWLVVWGNVFGGLIGVISLAAGYGS